MGEELFMQMGEVQSGWLENCVWCATVISAGTKTTSTTYVKYHNYSNVSCLRTTQIFLVQVRICSNFWTSSLHGGTVVSAAPSQLWVRFQAWGGFCLVFAGSPCVCVAFLRVPPTPRSLTLRNHACEVNCKL